MSDNYRIFVRRNPTTSKQFYIIITIKLLKTYDSISICYSYSVAHCPHDGLQGVWLQECYCHACCNDSSGPVCCSGHGHHA